jgi:cytochrome P450
MNDEFSHPAGPGKLWGESWYFDFADPGGAWGGYLRVGSYPNLGTGWAWLVLVGDEPGNFGSVRVIEHRLAPPRQYGPELVIAGPTAECLLRCRTSHELWSARAHAPGVSLDMSWRASAPEYRYQEATRYEQPCDVAGEITVHGRTVAVNAPGQRDHSWGVRDWWRIPWLWFAAQLDDGTRVHVTQLIVRRPFPAYGYVDSADGRRSLVEECQLSAGPGPGGTPPRRTELSLGPLDLALTTSWPTAVPLDGPDGQAGTLFRSLCVVETAGRQAGSGWLEWNQPGTARDLQRSGRRWHVFDPQDPAVLANPYPHYARLRREAPVVWLPDYDIWMVSRHRDVMEVLRDPQTYSSRLGHAAEPGRKEAGQTGIRYRIGAPGVRVLIAMDPPDHTAFRRAVRDGFTGSRIAQLGDAIKDVARQQIRCLLERSQAGGADFCRDVAGPVPTLVLGELLGLPKEMRPELFGWAQMVVADLDVTASGQDRLGRGQEMLRYFYREVRRRRGGSGTELLDVLANGYKHGLTEYEVLSFCGFLVVAGVETTTNQLTNLMDVLVKQPLVQERLRADPDLIPAAVQESVRYDGSVQGLWRSTAEAATLGGQELPAGARMFVLFGSANRDEEYVADPDSFLLDRASADHVGFGHGIHYCLGARLSRLEIETVLRELLSMTESFQAHGPSTRHASVALRGFSRQGVRVIPNP